MKWELIEIIERLGPRAMCKLAKDDNACHGIACTDCPFDGHGTLESTIEDINRDMGAEE